VNGAPFDPHIGRVLAGQYRVEALLGRGGMGAVYRGYQLSVGRPVAIKLISTGLPDPSQSLQRFRREAEATGRLNHPNTIRLFDFGLTDHGEVYMVMELLEGCDLSVRLQHGALPPSEAFHILRQMLSALSEAHACGIVHRDLKPGNVFLSYVQGDPSFVKVMDFGIAGMDEGRAAQKLTVTGAVMGTPAYMSPEQAQGKAVDARSDLYSCGVVLFEMLAGRTPFEADSLVAMLLAHVTQPPLRLEAAGVSFPGLPQVQSLIDSLLAKSPAGRPASAAHVLAAIDALHPQTFTQQAPAYKHVPRTTEPTPSEPLTPLGWDNRLKPSAATTPKLWLAAGALGLLVLGLSVELFLPAKRAPAPSATARPVKQTETQAQPALRVEPLPVQPAEAASASMTARTHTDVEDDALGEHKDTLADVPQADGSGELDDDEDAPAARSGKARSRSRSAAAAARRARTTSFLATRLPRAKTHLAPRRKPARGTLAKRFSQTCQNHIGALRDGKKLYTLFFR
jgi:serine/threonine-protein kinase